MRQLNGVYTQSYNRSHNVTAHVFQGRYKAILVEKQSYLLELSRYIVPNPVRAGMVRAAKDWSWSSYWATAGQVEPPASPWVSLRNQLLLGSDSFVERIQSTIDGEKELSEIPLSQRRPLPRKLGEYQETAKNRNTAIINAYKSGGYTMKEIGEHFGLHYKTVSGIIGNHKSKT